MFTTLCETHNRLATSLVDLGKHHFPNLGWRTYLASPDEVSKDPHHWVREGLVRVVLSCDIASSKMSCEARTTFKLLEDPGVSHVDVVTEFARRLVRALIDDYLMSDQRFAGSRYRLDKVGVMFQWGARR